MNREQALDALALACLVSAIDNPEGGGEFGEQLGALGVSLGDTVEVVRRMQLLGQRPKAEFEDAVRTLTSSRR